MIPKKFWEEFQSFSHSCINEEWGSMNMYEGHYCKNKWLDKAQFRFESYVSNNDGQAHCLNFDFHNENS